MVARHAPPPRPRADAPAAEVPVVPAPSTGPAEAPPPPRELIEGPTRDDLVRRRAYDLYQRNGQVDGRALDDWLAAEAEIGRMPLDGTAPLPAADGAP